MDSKNQGGRPSNDEIFTRRERIKELLLKGASYQEIEQALGISSATVRADIVYWTDYFQRVAQDNPEVARMNIAKVQQALSEIDLVKKQYWDAYKKLLEEQKEQEEFKRKWQEELQQTKLDYQKAVEDGNKSEQRRLLKQLKETGRIPRLPSLHKAQLENLKLIMDRIDKEAKLLNLFNPTIANPTQNKGLSWEAFKTVMMVFKQIILDLVPEDQRKYAFQRLRRVKLDEVKPEDIVEAELVQPAQAPQIGLKKIEEPVDAPTPAPQPIQEPEESSEDLDNDRF